MQPIPQSSTSGPPSSVSTPTLTATVQESAETSEATSSLVSHITLATKSVMVSIPMSSLGTKESSQPKSRPKRKAVK